VTGFGGEAGAVHARRVLDIAQHFARGAVHHHHVVGTRNEDAARGCFDGNVVGAAVAFDIELFNLERLCVPDAWRAEDDGGNEGDCDE